jgi:hypothetical protein
MKGTFLHELARAWLHRRAETSHGQRVWGLILTNLGLLLALMGIASTSRLLGLGAGIGLIGVGLLVVPLAHSRRRFCRRFARQKRVDPEVVERCLELLETERWPEPLAGHIRAALNAYAGICEIGQQAVWKEQGLSLEGYLASVKQAILSFLHAAQNVEKIGRLVRQYADQMRDAEAQRGVQARFARRNEELGRMAQGFERTLAWLMEAYFAAQDETVNAADVAASLREFGEAMASLTAGFDAAEEALNSLEENPHSSPRLTEGINAATALMQELDHGSGT